MEDTQVFALWQLSDKGIRKNKELHLISVDLKKAYDFIPRLKLWGR
jgi:hypothetical protein